MKRSLSLRVALLLLFGPILCGGALSAAEQRKPRPQQFEKPVLIRFEGVISPMSAAYLFRSLEKAKAGGATLVVVEFNSPGGYLRESLKIAHRLRDTDWAHTIAFVRKNEQALSGAAIASLGADEIIMGSNAVFGDAGLIYQGEGGLFRYTPEKLRSDLARRVRDLAEAGGRSPALAEAMIDMDLEVFKVRNKKTDEVAFKSKSEIETLDNRADWEKLQLVHESRKKKFLEVNGARAVELGLADANADTRQELRGQLNVGPDFRVIEPGTIDTAIYILNLPVVTGLLFIIGLVALYFEFSAPGISIGGLTAGLCFALFFWSRMLGGTAGWLEVILFFAGLIFLGVEIFVIPGFGVAGLTGILLLLSSVLMASHSFMLPTTTQDWNGVMVTLSVMAGSFVVVLVAVVAITRAYGKIPILSSFALEPPKVEAPATMLKATEKLAADPDAGGLVAVGDWGVADSPLRPAGKALFNDEFVDVVTDGTFVDAGVQVRVIKIEGNRIVVREIT